ncbi:50S ribosomal protein L13 [Thermosipho africanus Ob7]|jgi:large subunit ribosomal protein L13|uniref:Large ribosomal subunit protein uL13 n=2 Tax=Thermosipho TaxID=2420 RepID=RL13_THEAB|nr:MULTISPECIES: 50S ribosomal protein L13 [Thermosipho]B7ICN0.1 RecName: Full=Large ribosomal subunit protein uL13; AltName: Full=50S ribosomal protein L13 [Thermosipho africanus TCF52B]HCF37946.1 50S ribosomal protein L13 [Thermosipho africanus]ACJ75757.1 ribosomal protein L13 [Thermosipho africanus TCF52B]MBB6062145.1 large subunit ribosomal protein L13 [Thermosipho japonicus]MBZ4650056.1 rplM [Thermosipho sp. (in: thermotogales)]MDK2838568.1 large subunit ribosomal protein [Thermosipho sp
MARTLPIQKTTLLKKEEVKKDWYLINAEGQTLGRLATRIALVLMGKNKPNWTPHVDCGNFVVVINADKIKLTGKKWDQKIYYRHSGYPGGIKEFTARQLQQRNPEKLIQLAVKRMLPKTILGRKALKRLKIYAGSEHPHSAQKPIELNF